MKNLDINELALKAIYNELDQFITKYESGNVSKGDIAKIRAILPPQYVNSFKKGK